MTAPEATREELLDALRAVREAIDIPNPATVGDEEIWALIRNRRLGHAVVMLAGILGEDARPDVPWSVAYLRARLTEHPAEGYKTWDERMAGAGARPPGGRCPVNGGTVYLLHLDAPGFGHAKHYTGWTADLAARLAVHEQGQGARLLAVARAAGIGWTLARTWPGTRARERQLKRQGGASRRCPLCGIKPRDGGR